MNSQETPPKLTNEQLENVIRYICKDDDVELTDDEDNFDESDASDDSESDSGSEYSQSSVDSD